jgi:peptidoglycan hydrolase-like protein with peptidoglycan-binding domain
MQKFTKFAFATAFVLAAFIVVNVARAEVTVPPNLLVGSSGQEVMDLQAALNAAGYTSTLTVDGSFGPMTKAGVVWYQSAHALTADGVVGPMTAASINSMGGVVSNVPGCMAGALYSSTTGAPCTGGASSVPGCTMPGQLYSVTTGASCSGSVVSNPTGVGSIESDTLIGGYASELVGVGDMDHQVAGIQLKAASGGSDVTLTSLSLQFVMTGGTGTDTKMEKYFSNVSFWEEGTKVGSALASEFSQDTNSAYTNYVYSKTLTLSGAKILAGQKSNFYVGVSALPVIDSANTVSGGNTWRVIVSNIRFTDGTGASLTYNPTNCSSTSTCSFSFASAASANSVEVDIARATDDMKAHVKDVDATSNTNKVQLLKANFKAVGSNLHIDKIPVTITSSIGLNLMASTLYLQNASGVVLDSTTVQATGTSTAYTFKNLNQTITNGSSADFIVSADILPLPGTNSFVAGSTMSATIAGGVAGFDITDATGNTIGATKLVGSATGESVAFYDKGIMVDPISATAALTAGQSANDDIQTFTIAFKVTAFGSTVYMPTLAGTSGQKVIFGVDKSGVVQSNVAISGVVVDSGPFSPSLSANGNFVITSGTTENFTLTVSVTDGVTNTAGLYRAYLSSIKWDSVDVASGGTFSGTYNFNLGPTNAAFTTNYQNAN